MHHSTIQDPVNGQAGGLQARQAQPRSGSPRSAKGAPGGSLGITAKSSPPPTREMGARAARAEKYQALHQARVWIGRRVNKLLPDVQFPGEIFRTFDCRNVRTSCMVEVRHTTGMAANYRNLATCGSVWACPVCASRIQERRRLELEHLVQWAEDQGLQAIMVTFTFPHTGFDSLGNLLARQADAFKRFRRGSPFTKLKASIGFQGLVRSLEVTHGLANGWHPHTHELWLVDPKVGQEIRARLVELWERACIAAGLLDPADQAKVHAFRQHSVDVRLNATSGEYLAKQDSSRKWGITHEVAKATSKAGKAKGVHPHEFLIRMAKGDEARYFEYLEAMKGKRQLFWSPGLKGRCGLDDVSDDDAALGGDDLDHLGNLNQDEWDFIRSRRLAAQVLDAAELGGFDLILRYLKRQGYKPPDFGTTSADQDEHRHPGLAPYSVT